MQEIAYFIYGIFLPLQLEKKFYSNIIIDWYS